ncbi:hypothetical protein GGI19_002808 [Coemansia pectinata]|uniref:Uncharacterized protein n=1 Tax=Coemansia pectinata TaxID=1052879 RepID=A0A9W8H0V8_9FUNG|nr:hypothetical protein GGI19_002808 [Coemansia pectinata]
MDSTTERPDTVYYEANSNLEAPATEQLDQPASSNEEKAEQAPVSSLETPTTDQLKPLSRVNSLLAKVKISTEKIAPLARVSSFLAKVGLSTEDPKPLSRDSTSPSNEEPETDGFIALARRFGPLTKEELATDRPSTHSRKSSTCRKEGNITERLVPLLDKGLIDNWDQRTGAIITFNDGTEGFKLIPKAAVAIQSME